MAAAVAIGAFVLVYVLLITERVERMVAAFIGAGLVLGLGVVGTSDTFFDETTGIDWTVLLLLFSMMVVVGGLRRAGLFDFLAVWLARRSGGRSYRLLCMLCALAAVSAIFLSDVTVVVLLAPVTLLVADRLGWSPVPLLVAEVLAANIGGSASLIGDPAGLIVGTRADITFVDYLLHQLPLAVVAFAVFLVLARFLFAAAMPNEASAIETLERLDASAAISDRQLLVRALTVVGLVLVGFVTQPWTGLEPAVVALLGAGAMALVVRHDRAELLDHVEWETLAFLAGLFVVVGALVKTGVVAHLTDAVASAVGGSPAAAVLGMLVGSAGASALIDNIPYVTTMTPVVTDLTAADASLNPDGALWYALAMGAVLGGNATAIGASANIVAIGIARRHGHRIGFWTFTRYGSVVAVTTVAAMVPLFALRYL